MITHGLVICTPTPARFAGNRKEPDHFLFADHFPALSDWLRARGQRSLIAQFSARLRNKNRLP